ncbi:MAG: hypothetical protein HY561_04425 [Gemmatimonadetes bacterium]|nr:hypothetical protein [Gemmatimonadota bacterium]
MRVLLLALVIAIGAAPTALAQESELEQTLERLAALWARGDASALAGLSARAGLALVLDGSPVGPLAPRQAAAVLRRIFDERETVGLKTGFAKIVGGAPRRAFAELNWLARARGTTIPERATVFLALVQEADGWRITQIRLLP